MMMIGMVEKGYPPPRPPPPPPRLPARDWLKNNPWEFGIAFCGRRPNEKRSERILWFGGISFGSNTFQYGIMKTGTGPIGDT